MHNVFNMPCTSIHILKKYLHAGGHGSDSESTVLDHTSGHFDDNNIMLLCNCVLANAGGVYQDIIISQRNIICLDYILFDVFKTSVTWV